MNLSVLSLFAAVALIPSVLANVAREQATSRLMAQRED
jgi:hypothetical protein